jgi:hypothetical protein
MENTILIPLQIANGNRGETTQGANGIRGETTQGANGIRGETTRYPANYRFVVHLLIVL